MLSFNDRPQPRRCRFRPLPFPCSPRLSLTSPFPAVVTGVFLLVFCLRGRAEVPGVDFGRDVRSVVGETCAKCHSPEKPKGGVVLTTATNETSVFLDPRTWETVARVVRERDMPPPGKPQPGEPERARMVQSVLKILDAIDESTLPQVAGRKVIHRLSRLEYNNTIRDLLGVETHPADAFPSDGSGGGGFDNNAATLFVPPILMEKLLQAAGDVLAAAAPERFVAVRPGYFTPPDWAARKSLEAFVPRAYRRPVSSEEIEPLVGLVAAARSRGASFEDSLRFALKAVLVSPNFLFRVEPDPPPGETRRLNDHELASRLSYFLWASMPDGLLLTLADQARLHEPAVLRAQIDRMLLDPKARSFGESFVSQWLGIRSLKTTTHPDHGRFPSYTATLRDAMCDEPVRLFEHLLREDGSLVDLLDADYTFANEELAAHYGIPGVRGPEMRRVALKDRTRGGVVCMGSVLTMTSYPLRTSPVLRGKWLMEEILGTPSPPPPPNVVGLPPDDARKDGLTFRQQLEVHRKKPDCAACHERMDPLGFGLENFDAIGRWRDEVSGARVDASGKMASGESFDGPAELKKILVQRRDEFVRNLTEKALAYALARGLEYYDTPAVRRIVKGVKADHYRIRTLVFEIATCYPFQHRSADPGAQNP